MVALRCKSLASLDCKLTQAAYEAEDKDYDRYSQHTADQINKGIVEGIEKGKLEGIEEGLQKGEKDKAIKMARKLLFKGVDIETILEAAEILSAEEIQSLKTGL